MSTAVVEHEQLSKDVEGLASECPAQINSPEEFESGNAWLIKVTKRRKEIEGIFAGLIKPFKLAMENHRKTCKELLAPLVEKETSLREMNRQWTLAERERARKEQERLNAQHAKKVERAIEKGKDISAIAPPSVVVTQPKTMKTDQGKVTYKDVKKVRIFDQSIIPESYFDRVLNEKRVKADALTGKEIPGVQVYDDVEEAVGV